MVYVNKFSVYEYFMICHSILNKLKRGRYFSSEKKLDHYFSYNIITVTQSFRERCVKFSPTVIGCSWMKSLTQAVCLEGTHKAAGLIMMTGGAGVFLWGPVLHLKMGSPKFFLPWMIWSSLEWHLNI